MSSQSATGAEIGRRRLLGLVGAVGAAALAGCTSSSDTKGGTTPSTTPQPPTTTGAPPTTTAATTAPTTTVPLPRAGGIQVLSANFAPVRESSALGLRVSGTLPEALRGHFFRHGPNPIDPDPDLYSWFTGDGMLHVTSLGPAGGPSYRCRYIGTDPVADALGRRRAPGAAPLLTDLSNTVVVRLGDAVLSTTEASLPFRVDDRARTIERVDLGGLTHGLSAHPKWDPVRREMHQVSYSPAAPPYLAYQVITPIDGPGVGTVIRNVPIDVPASPVVHTMSLTETHAVVYDLPVHLSPDLLGAGFPFPYRWNPAGEARIGLIRRDGGDEVRWIGIDPCFVFHDQGAHDVVIEDAAGTRPGIEVTLAVHDKAYHEDDPRQFGSAQPRLERWVVDIERGTVERTVLDDRPQEFPRVNDAAGIGARRYLYTVAAGTAAAAREPLGYLALSNLLVRRDLTTGATTTVGFGSARSAVEPVFVPDPARSAQEDGGWVITYVWDATTDTSSLVVLDAEDLADGPVAEVQLPTRVPIGFHGTWVPA